MVFDYTTSYMAGILITAIVLVILVYSLISEYRSQRVRLAPGITLPLFGLVLGMVFGIVLGIILGSSISQIFGIYITGGYLGYLVFVIFHDNRFTRNLPSKPKPNPLLAEARRRKRGTWVRLHKEESEEREEHGEIIDLTHDYSCYECANYHFQRRFCLTDRPSATHWPEYLDHKLYYKPDTKDYMMAESERGERLMIPGEFKVCYMYRDGATLREDDPEAIFVERKTGIIFGVVSLLIFTVLYLLSRFVIEFPVLEFNLLHVYATGFWINGWFWSLAGVTLMGDDYYRRGLISALDYNIPVIGTVIGTFGAALAHILYLYEIHDLEFLGFIVIGIGAVLALKDWSDIDILAIPYEGKILLETELPLTEEDLEEVSQDIGLTKPHAPDYAGNNKRINMDVFAINKTDTAKTVILSYVASCLEPQTDSIKLLIPPHKKSKKTFVPFTKRKGTYYVSFRLADEHNNVLEERNELITIQPEITGFMSRVLAVLLTSIVSIIQVAYALQ